MAKVNVDNIRELRRRFPTVQQRRLARLIATGDVGSLPHSANDLDLSVKSNGYAQFYKVYHVIRRHDALERQKQEARINPWHQL